MVNKSRALARPRHDDVSEHVGARITAKEAKRLDALVEAGTFLNRSDAVRSAVRDLISRVRIVHVRKASLEQAKQEVLAYLDQHEEAYPSDIADESGIDYDAVQRALNDLRQKGEVETV